MAFLKFILWTGCAVSLGVFIATYEVNGRTPLEHGQRAWKRNVSPSLVDQMKEGLRDVTSGANTAAGGRNTPSRAPTENIRPQEREAVNRLIAQQP